MHALLGATIANVMGEDWPCWRGPNLNGISAEKGWQTAWPPSGPKRLWRVEVGTGFSSLAVSQGRLYTMGNQGNQDTVHCLDAET
ncbi:MAG: PQQ-binding-like beta-propeller repeat protein, partial [Pedosphaera parvula]|nr:PQQ-binding-like beta-propeller repeat protein [Pedosphaera parvula]